MPIRTFELERIQSLYENTVEYNLTESGFHPFTLQELLTPAELHELTHTVLGYGQTNGSIPARQRIAALYPDGTEDQVLICNGSSEANFVACHSLLEAGDEIVMMLPNYMQIWGVAEELGAIPRSFSLQSSANWAADLEDLRQQVSPNTNMIALCNPNNPTGYTLSLEEMQEIVTIAEHVDAWIYADEVYRGAELDGVERPSFLGMYPKTVVAGGLSKAYALPGLRLGWLAGPADFIANCWAYHDYTSITAGILSHKVAEIVLEPSRRLQILNRNRRMLNQNLKILQDWLSQQTIPFEFVPPSAGGMAFLKYGFDMNSSKLSNWLRINKGVFIIAGDCYGMDGYLRIGIGGEPEYLMGGLDRLAEGLRELIR